MCVHISRAQSIGLFTVLLFPARLSPCEGSRLELHRPLSPGRTADVADKVRLLVHNPAIFAVHGTGRRVFAPWMVRSFVQRSRGAMEKYPRT
ncbi:protein of unknown function (plasmid) [Cupriavidus taiwanensis]|nr:protein of unknown function [Cupriavidus taiwanensis]